MAADRMADALTTTGRGAPVVDLIAPVEAPQVDPDDTLSSLLVVPNRGEFTAEEERRIRRLAFWQQERSQAKEKYDSLRAPIEEEQTWLLELVAEKQLYDERGKLAVPELDNGNGFNLAPYGRNNTWPKYRDNDETGTPFEVEDLIAALREVGEDVLIVERTEQFAWPAYVRDRLKRWHRKLGKSNGLTDPEGRYLDLDGEVITDPDELADPTHDRLCLPAPLRRVVEPVVTTKVLFSYHARQSQAVTELDAAEDAAEAAAES